MVIGALVALAQVDLQVILFVRSLHNPFIEQVGNVGNRLGHGVTLVLIGGVVLVLGYWKKRSDWRQAGLDCWIAHGVVGLITQIPKRIIGRPRPRFTHQDPFQFGPSLESGLDTFPSGHSSASFAVAAVLARYFPNGKWIWYGAAAFVAGSRVIRGSHFPTDVLAGAILGYATGYILARPLREWKSSVMQVLPQGVPVLAVTFSLVWILLQRPSGSWIPMVMTWVGSLGLVGGMGWRVWRTIRGQGMVQLNSGESWPANLCIICGMAMFTGSWLVLCFTLLGCLVWWLSQRNGYGCTMVSPLSHEPVHMESSFPVQKTPQPAWPVIRECLIGVMLMTGLFILSEIKSLLPLI